MQFVKEGPDVPEQLLQAHEEGQVVFFCGAGISRPAGLPTFSDLVEQLYDAMGIDPDPVENSAIKASQYDTAVGLLEAKVMGGRSAVRKELVQILTPNLSTRNAIATHEALLILGKDRSDRTRLITTNFDRLFEEVIAKTPLQVQHYRAPLLPVPKKRWDGLVYLHGLLTENPSESDLETLIVSSGDFGLAYLTERWAARFVSELLRNFVVCFVGYSIDDPVLRYMMDALAADRMLGESPPEMFAFGGYSKGKKEVAERKWRAKNVTPILYREFRHHVYLRQTLQAWSKTYRDGARGKVQIVVENAMTRRPLASTEQDNFVGRVIWALSDPSGLPAKRFAELDPVPSLEWLEPLSEERFRHADLVRFRISPNGAVKNNIAFSLICRPSPYKLAPRMALVDSGAIPCRWDNVMEQIAQWLIRHLNDPAALLWLAKRGGVLHKELVRLIEWRLEKLDRLDQNNDQAALQKISANAPNAIPGSKMRTLWQLLLKGRVRTQFDDFDFHRWCQQFRSDGLTVILRLDLRKKLTPCVVLNEPFDWPFEEEDEEPDEPEHMSKLVRAEVVLSTQGVREQLLELVGEERWATALPELLNEFSGLLRDTLDLMRELGQADYDNDQSYLSQPSISEHSQNHGYQDWTALIELVRDAWLRTCVQSLEKARAAAEEWLQTPYPVFRRLAFFAASRDKTIPRSQALDWLLSDQCRWLWSQETLREAMRLLVAIAPKMDEAELKRFELAILAGPPRVMYLEDLEPEVWTRIQDREIWLRLAKLADCGARLSAAGIKRMSEISVRYPDWQLAENEQDEFSIWEGDVTWSEGREFVVTPRELKELIEWLKVNADNDPRQRDNWSERCREDFDTTSRALTELVKQGIWPIRRWREALIVWTEEELIERSWSNVAPIIARTPDEILKELSHGVSHWLRSLAKRFEGHEATFLTLCDRLFELEYENDESVDDPVGRAINHPVGKVTDALLNWWYRRPLTDGQGLNENLNSRFSMICDTQVSKLRHGRVLLAAHVVALFRVDRKWTTRFVLPLFEWERSRIEAKSAWEGFLWSPRFFPPMLEALKLAFLDTASHYEALGQHGVQYSSLLTFEALEPKSVFTRRELRSATEALTQEGLNNAAETVVRALEGAGEQHVEYWNNRAKRYLTKVWPKTRNVASASIAESFARMCVAAGDEFPAALKVLSPWLQEIANPARAVHHLHKANLHEKFPEATLEFLDEIIRDDRLSPPEELVDCLQTIREKIPQLEADRRFQRLVEYLQVHGKVLD